MGSEVGHSMEGEGNNGNCKSLSIQVVATVGETTNELLTFVPKDQYSVSPKMLFS
jgi:hypothetical protein